MKMNDRYNNSNLHKHIFKRELYLYACGLLS